MVDIQSGRDERQVELEQVGVRDLRYPITVLDREKQYQQTVGTISMAVNLPHHFKGTHMSRFVEILNQCHGEITLRTLPTILATLQERLEAESARVRIEFSYFLRKQAPVSGACSLLDYRCWFEGEQRGRVGDFLLGVEVPVTSLCPCSKAISDYSAHNQRGYVTIETRSVETEASTPQVIWIEELVEVAEQSGSAPIYPLLKRVDERHVTMQAYDNPVFVEDIVRNVAVRLRKDERIKWFRVETVNHESIHNHSAYASTTWSRVRTTKRDELLIGCGATA